MFCFARIVKNDTTEYRYYFQKKITVAIKYRMFFLNWMKIKKENLKVARAVVRNFRTAVKNNSINSATDFYKLTELDSRLGKFCLTARTDPNDAQSYDCRQCIFSYGKELNSKGLYCLSFVDYKFNDESETIITTKKFFKRLQKSVADYYKDLTSKYCDKITMEN